MSLAASGQEPGARTQCCARASAACRGLAKGLQRAFSHWLISLQPLQRDIVRRRRAAHRELESGQRRFILPIDEIGFPSTGASCPAFTSPVSSRRLLWLAQLPRALRRAPTSPGLTSDQHYHGLHAPHPGSAEGFGDRYHVTPQSEATIGWRLKQCIRRTLPPSVFLVVMRLAACYLQWASCQVKRCKSNLYNGRWPLPQPNSPCNRACPSSPRLTASRLQQKIPPRKLSPRIALPASFTRDCIVVMLVATYTS